LKRFLPVLLALAATIAPTMAKAQEPAAPTTPTTATRVVVRARSDDASLNTRLQAALEAELNKVPGYVIDERAPLGQLLVYANLDVNDRKNPKGVTLAIAIVSNAPTYYLAIRVLPDGPNQIKDPDARRALASMMQETGFLQVLNTAHLDEASDAEIAETAQSIVGQFSKKIPPNAGG
jgi:hypothetical protein